MQCQRVEGRNRRPVRFLVKNSQQQDCQPSLAKCSQRFLSYSFCDNAVARDSEFMQLRLFSSGISVWAAADFSGLEPRYAQEYVVEQRRMTLPVVGGRASSGYGDCFGDRMAKPLK